MQRIWVILALFFVLFLTTVDAVHEKDGMRSRNRRAGGKRGAQVYKVPETDQLGSLDDKEKFEAGMPSENMAEVQVPETVLSFIPGPMPTSDPLPKKQAAARRANMSKAAKEKRKRRSRAKAKKKGRKTAKKHKGVSPTISQPIPATKGNMTSNPVITSNVTIASSSTWREAGNAANLISSIASSIQARNVSAVAGAQLNKLTSTIATGDHLAEAATGNSTGNGSVNATGASISSQVNSLNISSALQITAGTLNKNAKDVLGEVTMIENNNVVPQIPDHEPRILMQKEEADSETFGAFGARSREFSPNTGGLPDMDEDIQFPDEEEESDADAPEVLELLRKNNFDIDNDA